jgi:hypothetical protein
MARTGVTRVKKERPTVMTVTECVVPAPRKLDVPQFEDMNGDKHFDEASALEANRKFVVHQIVERDIAVNGDIGGYEEETVEFVLRNQLQLRTVLMPFSDQMVSHYEQHMDKKFGAGKWQARDGEPKENHLIRVATWDAFRAGWLGGA